MALIQKIQTLAVSAVVVSSAGAFVSYLNSLRNEISIPETSDNEKKTFTPVDIKDYTSFDNWLSPTKPTEDFTNSHLSWF